MMIIGCDYHPSWQQICWLDTLTGETEKRSWSMRREKRSGFIGSCTRLLSLGWSPLGTVSGLWRWPQRWGTTFGSEMRRRFAPARCVRKSTTGEMRHLF